MGALDVVVAFHDERGPAAGLGAQMESVEVVLPRRLALVHGQDAGGGQLAGDGLGGQSEKVRAGMGMSCGGGGLSQLIFVGTALA
jgi:hypothetical protein